MNKGFTLIELLVSMGVMGLLIGFSSWAYLTVEKNSNLANQTSQLISSFRQAQALAISNTTQDQNNYLNIGIHFQSNSYTIFKGSQYNPNDSNNITTNLPAGISLNIDLPTNDLLYLFNSGEISSFDSNHNRVTITQAGGVAKILRINRLGVVDVE